MSTTDDGGRGAFVTREVCAAIHAEQQEANRRTWDELRGLRRLLVAVVLGGQLFAGGLQLAGTAWWFQEHAAHPHPVTARALEQVRAEVRQDLREMRADLRALSAAQGGRPAPSPAADPEKETRDDP